MGVWVWGTMSDETTDPRDIEFAVDVGYQLGQQTFSGGGLAVAAPVGVEEATQLFLQVEETVLGYLSDGFGQAGLPRRMRDEFVTQLSDGLKAIEATESYGVPTLRGMINGFDLNPIVNVLDARTLRAFDLHEHGSDHRPVYDRYAIDERPGLAERIELLDEATARRSLITLFADAVRSSLSHFGRSPAANLAASSTASFTVNTKLTGYVLDYYTQFNATLMAFGANTTTPVTDAITSGKYHFQGSLGTTIQNDGRLHYAGGSRNATVLNW